MTNASLVAGFVLLALVGFGVSRFNPTLLYPRRALFGLFVLTVAAIGAVLALGFFGAPTAPPSGVVNVNGG